MREYKLVGLGSGGVGKSALTVQFVQGIFVEKYDPAIEDSYRKEVEVDCQQRIVEILNTAGTEQFTARRDLYMKNGQGFALVYSITAQSMFNDLQDLREQILWVKDTEDVPMILVGSKCDLEDERVVAKEQGQNLARQWCNYAFSESSAKSKINVNEIVYELIRQINRKAPVEKKKPQKKSCLLLWTLRSAATLSQSAEMKNWGLTERGGHSRLQKRNLKRRLLFYILCEEFRSYSGLYEFPGDKVALCISLGNKK